MASIYLLLGSNMGDKKAHLNQAMILIRQQIGEIVAQSSIYETEPWGFKDNSYFLNQVLKIRTSLHPESLLTDILSIEKKIGRQRIKNQYESRIIDIDILFYDELIINSEQLTIPHPLIEKRKFVLIPLVEIADDFIHPVSGKTMNCLLNECKDKSEVKKIS